MVDVLEDGAALQALLKMTLEKASKLDDERFCSAKVVDLLWKWVLRYGDNTLFETLVNKQKQANPSCLGPSIEALLQQCSESDTTGEIYTLAQTVASNRVQWLKDQIELLDRPFLWEMPQAKSNKNAQVTAFLRGSEESMTTTGVHTFSDIEEAREWAEQWAC